MTITRGRGTEDSGNVLCTWKKKVQIQYFDRTAKIM